MISPFILYYPFSWQSTNFIEAEVWVLFPLQNPTGDPQDELLLSLFQSLTRSFISPFCGFDLFREGSLLDIQPGFLFPRVLIVLKLIPLTLSQSLAVSPPSPSKQLAHYLHILLLMIKLSHHLYLNLLDLWELVAHQMCAITFTPHGISPVSSL